MTIKEPSVELWLQDDPIVHVAKCARVCYGSPTEGKSTAQDLYDRLLKAKHNSMFRHESVYAVIPYSDAVGNYLHLFQESPYIDYKVADDAIYLATNGNWMIDNKRDDIMDYIRAYKVTPEEFGNKSETAFNMMRYTFHIVTQISTSRELNRASPNNIAERSTRYVNESDGAICRPHWFSSNELDAIRNASFDKISIERAILIDTYLNSCKTSFAIYRKLLSEGVKRQDARGVLPLDTATEVVYTYSISEWKHIIELRSDKRAHPNCQIIANMIKAELEKMGYSL